MGSDIACRDTGHSGGSVSSGGGGGGGGGSDDDSGGGGGGSDTRDAGGSDGLNFSRVLGFTYVSHYTGPRTFSPTE